VSETSPSEPDEPTLERLHRQDTRLDHYIDRYAARAHGMTASAIRALFAVANRPEVVSLAGGMPNITDLPLDVVGSVLNELVLTDGRRAMQYGSGQGEPAIREAICEVMRLENISAHPDDVMVSVGSQQGLDLLTRIFCNPGDVVLCEAPSYVGALGVFRSYQCEVVHVAMDEQGLNPTALADAAQGAASGWANGQIPLHHSELPQSRWRHSVPRIGGSSCCTSPKGPICWWSRTIPTGCSVSTASRSQPCAH
jgi:DNA-binding transcriptional MocR family regulator